MSALSGPIIEPLLRIVLAALCAAVLAVAPAHAQTPDNDPPGRVGRIADISGPVWLYSPDAGEWIEAVRNRPVTSGDRLATEGASRAEFSVGSTTFRLDAGSELEVLRLDDEQIALHLHAGTAAVRVRDLAAAGDIELWTDEGRSRLQAAGAYRLDRVDRSSHLTVHVGQAFFEGAGSAVRLTAGQRGEFWLEPRGAVQYSLTEPVRDAFASWNEGRDREQDRLASLRFLSPEMTGARELERHGTWEQSTEFGPLWLPRAVPAGWAPYSTGHWAWIRPWGWTWVDEAPWGFAPFHYGRWVWHRSVWAWAPGSFVARPVYAPALVAWVGGPAAGLSVTVGGGPTVGWFPLAPREVYVPAYRTSPRYLRDVNSTHVRQGTQIVHDPAYAYRNLRHPRAVTLVPASVLAQRQPVGPGAERLRGLPGWRDAIGGSRQFAVVAAPPLGAPPRAAGGVDMRPYRRAGDADLRWSTRPERGMPAPAGGAAANGRSAGERDPAYRPGPAWRSDRPAAGRDPDYRPGPAWRSDRPAAGRGPDMAERPQLPGPEQRMRIPEDRRPRLPIGTTDDRPPGRASLRREAPGGDASGRGASGGESPGRESPRRESGRESSGRGSPDGEMSLRESHRRESPGPGRESFGRGSFGRESPGRPSSGRALPGGEPTVREAPVVESPPAVRRPRSDGGLRDRFVAPLQGVAPAAPPGIAGGAPPPRAAPSLRRPEAASPSVRPAETPRPRQAGPDRPESLRGAARPAIVAQPETPP